MVAVAGTAFSGTFRRAIPSGHIMRSSQSVGLSETATFEVSVERFAAACLPPAPPVVLPDTTAPSGKLIMAAFLRKSLLRSTGGQSVKVDISEAGSVKVDVYADNGAKLPALKAGAAATKKKAKLVRLAFGKKSTATAARVKVKLKTTTLGRRAMKPRKRVRARVVTTLTDVAGNRTRLKVKKITLR